MKEKKKNTRCRVLNSAAEPPRHFQDKGGETAKRSSTVSLVLPPFSLFSASLRSLLSLLSTVRLNLFCKEVGNTCISHAYSVSVLN